MKKKQSNRIDPDNLMELTRQTVGFLNAINADKDMQMAAFMTIFHPDHVAKEKKKGHPLRHLVENMRSNISAKRTKNKAKKK